MLFTSRDARSCDICLRPTAELAAKFQRISVKVITIRPGRGHPFLLPPAERDLHLLRNGTDPGGYPRCFKAGADPNRLDHAGEIGTRPARRWPRPSRTTPPSRRSTFQGLTACSRRAGRGGAAAPEPSGGQLLEERTRRRLQLAPSLRNYPCSRASAKIGQLHEGMARAHGRVRVGL